MPKVKVIEVEAIKLDPNAKYLIVFNERQIPMQAMEHIAANLEKLGVKAVYTHAINPEEALKVYQIPSPLLDGEKTHG